MTDCSQHFGEDLASVDSVTRVVYFQYTLVAVLIKFCLMKAFGLLLTTTVKKLPRERFQDRSYAIKLSLRGIKYLESSICTCADSYRSIFDLRGKCTTNQMTTKGVTCVAIEARVSLRCVPYPFKRRVLPV
jgi:hypothetical protein